jgi:predicted nucleic acid-binding protein
MKKQKIFVDSNVIISGTFFSGLESVVLRLVDVDIISADICCEEVLEVVRRKFKDFRVETKIIALEEVKKSFEGINIIRENRYKGKMKEASKLVKGKNDRKVLAAVLAVKPDFFVTGDKHFHTKKLREKIRVTRTRELLRSLKYI